MQGSKKLRVLSRTISDLLWISILLSYSMLIFIFFDFGILPVMLTLLSYLFIPGYALVAVARTLHPWDDMK